MPSGTCRDHAFDTMTRQCMSSRLAAMLKALAVTLAGGCIAACALVARQPEKLPDGNYRISCDAPLSSCLESFENVCQTRGYEVIFREFDGDHEIPLEVMRGGLRWVAKA